MAVLRKFILALALIALTTGSGYAQIAPLPDNSTPPTKEEREKKAADDAYRSSLRKSPRPKTPPIRGAMCAQAPPRRRPRKSNNEKAPSGQQTLKVSPAMAAGVADRLWRAGNAARGKAQNVRQTASRYFSWYFSWHFHLAFGIRRRPRAGDGLPGVGLR